jgi:hypothetical protein
MMGWRPARVRPRNGQRLAAFVIGMVVVGVYDCDKISWNGGCVFVGPPRQYYYSWSVIDAWIPERELIQQARAAGKKVE